MLLGKDKPIIILDLDETIIGNIYPQLDENNIISALNIKKSPNQFRLYKENFKYDLKNSFIIRPYFKKFLESCKKHNYNVFIYSASTCQWLKFIIELIELTINYKFERPLFSRKDLDKIQYSNKYGKYIELIKSIDKIKPKIYKSLKKTNNLPPIHHFNNIIMIDNRIDIIIDRKKYKVIKCPAYNYIHIIDPLRNLSEEQKQTNFSKISQIIFNKSYSNYEYFIKKNYEKYLHDFTLKTNIDKNEYYKKDTFWLNLINDNKSLFG